MARDSVSAKVQAIKIFYSWQSDLPEDSNRFYIRDALKASIAKLNRGYVLEQSTRDEDAHVGRTPRATAKPKRTPSAELDYDTKGVSGTPDLAATIFEKINRSDVFVADVSIVGKSARGRRHFPNPNVLLELGYAFAKLGSDNIILVMDSRHGKPEKLPFDLRHKRHPIQFSSANDSKLEKAKLVETFIAALKPFLEKEKQNETSLALLTVPSREEIFEQIMESDSEDDWHRCTATGWHEVWYFKRNVNLRFEIKYTEEGKQRENFYAKWANKYPDENATGYWIYLYFDNTLIDRFILVSVDGGRAFLPIPEIGTLEVTPFNYKLAQIFDRSNTLSDYFSWSDLKLKKTAKK